jgi:hypothetical protein
MEPMQLWNALYNEFKVITKSMLLALEEELSRIRKG